MLMSKVLWKGKDVPRIVKGHGPSDWNAYGISIDTRTLRKGDIFFALAGPNYDGHQFINEAIKKGACVVVSNAPVLNHEKKVIVVNRELIIDMLKSNDMFLIATNFLNIDV